ncbi:MAG: ribonuclease T [Gammaproteobacteria bacterium TMED180]|nr:MAG: ribonuclease T [Gammaproteobacteria bacterium TMED180]
MIDLPEQDRPNMSNRFRGYLPVVLDVETGGFNPGTDALLESAIAMIQMNDSGFLELGETLSFNIKPFQGANIEDSALQFTGIDPDHPFRYAIDEKEALEKMFSKVRKEIKRTGCHRAIVVAHNASFDHSFLCRAAERCEIKRNPFHPFSTFDTATLAGLAYGQTVLARACEAAGISFNNDEAHSAAYDCNKTAELFCQIVNKWERLSYEN